MAAGTVTEKLTQIRNGNLKIWVLEFAWAGSTTDPATAVSTATINKIGGLYLFLMKTIPGASSAAPTAAYDITLTDSDTLDVLQGTGLDRSATAIETTVPKQDTNQTLFGPVFIDSGGLTLHITNNSNASATGTIRFYFSE